MRGSRLKKLVGRIAVVGMIMGFFLATCNRNEECGDCGGTVLQGYVFRNVTEEDFAKFASVKGIKVDACMRYKLSGGEINEETIAIVDDCCCE